MNQMLLKPPRTRASGSHGRRLRRAGYAEAKTSGSAQLASYFRWKQLFDRVLALLLLVPALPLIGLCALLVLLTSGRPVFYTQKRTGHLGRSFTMFKIRTMRQNAEARSGAVWSPDNDRRVTWLGRYLRSTHLDELPQLLNVVRGDMNLIGPRPERPAIVRQLIREVPGYADRLAIPPGITGLAQVQLPSDTEVADVRRKLVCDVHYMQHASLLMDLQIVARTIPHLFALTRAARRQQQPAAALWPRQLAYRLAHLSSPDHVTAPAGPVVQNVA